MPTLSPVNTPSGGPLAFCVEAMVQVGRDTTDTTAKSKFSVVGAATSAGLALMASTSEDSVSLGSRSTLGRKREQRQPREAQDESLRTGKQRVSCVGWIREEVLTKASLMRVGEVVSRSQFSLRLWRLPVHPHAHTAHLPAHQWSCCSLKHASPHPPPPRHVYPATEVRA
jgi:hypothetical protein